MTWLAATELATILVLSWKVLRMAWRVDAIDAELVLIRRQRNHRARFSGEGS